jgi:phosphopantothenoylcysteine decarboxylase/phosphopantothenate--cysteine ligase
VHRVTLGVSGGIAAYKACSLLRLLSESGCDVTVVPTESALHFVGSATWSALSGKPVATDVWSDAQGVAHVRIGRESDLVVVAPATADLLARAAQGLANDLLTNVLLTARCPVLMAPAMHTEMWEHPATQANVATLRSRGVIVIDPAVGRLTGSDSGAGRLPEPEQLAEVVLATLAVGGRRDLTGRKIVISSGGTREPLDPVRYLGNRSSGRQGWALASAAAARGADVTVVAANVDFLAPLGVGVLRVETAEQMRVAVHAASADAEVVVMAAAVADFRPNMAAADKIKKSGQEPDPLDLVLNPDILAELVAHRGAATRPLLVGFAAETGDARGTVLDHGRAKLASKGCDLLVVNDVSGDQAFGALDNAAVILDQSGVSREVPRGPKLDLANAVWDVVAARV